MLGEIRGTYVGHVWDNSGTIWEVCWKVLSTCVKGLNEYKSCKQASNTD